MISRSADYSQRRATVVSAGAKAGKCDLSAWPNHVKPMDKYVTAMIESLTSKLAETRADVENDLWQRLLQYIPEDQIVDHLAARGLEVRSTKGLDTLLNGGD